jgi:lipopolysaccharide/colanic/teichoic acid biosynthesis glycosyltransferase
MRIAITGASGFLGRQLVERLQKRNVELLLVGRDPASLRVLFPDCQAISYDEIAIHAKGCDALLHLAVVNNDSSEKPEVFHQVNCMLTTRTCMQAREAGIKRFIFTSSVRALNFKDQSPYAESKRFAVEELAKIDGIDVEVLYLPAVVGDQFAGRLANLQRLPATLQKAALLFLQLLKPVVKVDSVTNAVISASNRVGDQFELRIVSDGQVANPVFTQIKRVIDVTFALGVVFFLWWAMILIWIAIRLDSPGPGIFRQVRTGRDGLVFTCYKFRTMQLSTPNVATHEISTSAITRLGGFLRRSKLDELPQVVNLLRNDMSLVGPRPCLPSQEVLVEARKARGVLRIKPGITGFAQINGIDMSDPERLAKWDECYLQLQTLLLDIKIILATAGGRGHQTKRENCPFLLSDISVNGTKAA